MTLLEAMLNPSMLDHYMQNYFSIMLHLLFKTFIRANKTANLE